MDKYVLVEYLSSIKSVLCETFKNTQRIKPISIDVSNRYIVLGTTSGGIYIFKRSPCEFLRLIPSKEGPTVQVKICPNDKHLAIVSAKGTVIILENCFEDMNFRPSLYADHEGNTVTAMRWHGNDLYCGDNVGKVSVRTLPSTLMQAIFQSHSTNILELDSSVVQLDIFKSSLLVSTQTRCYICDIEKEQFKQIGKKMRDGSFGACFSSVDTSDSCDTRQGLRGVFSTITMGENLSSILHNNNLKIYCARPSVRIWTANVYGEVLKTHQFKHSLDIDPTNVIIKNDENLRLSMTSIDTKISPNFNLGKLFVLSPHMNIVLTYDENGIYFFNLESSSLLLWTCNYTNIKDIKIINHYIYVWSNISDINIISLQTLEDLLLSTFCNNQFKMCAELCSYFNKDVLKLIEQSKKIRLMSVFKTKLQELGEDEIVEKIRDILDKLSEQYNEPKTGIMLENGAVTIDNQYSSKDIPESIDHSELTPSENEDLKILYKQYVINKTYNFAELTESTNVINKFSLNNLSELFEKFNKYVQEKDSEDSSMWCKKQMLKVASKNLGKLSKSSLDFIEEQFLEINDFSEYLCKCKFPLPTAHTKNMTYYNLACQLYEYSNNKSTYLDKIPLLHKYNFTKSKIIPDLPLMVQYSDKEVYKDLLDQITYDIWDEIAKLFIKLRQGHCLNCNEKISTEGTMSWDEIGMFMVQSIRGDNATRLLLRYADSISNGQLGTDFYMTCMISFMCKEEESVAKFVENTQNGEKSEEIVNELGEFLMKKFPKGHQDHH